MMMVRFSENAFPRAKKYSGLDWMMMVRFSDWLINLQLECPSNRRWGFAWEPYERCSAISFAGPDGSGFVFQGFFSLGERGSIFLLVGERQKCLLTPRIPTRLWQVDDISGLGHVVGNVFRCLDTPQLDQTFTRLCKRTGKQLCSFCVSFSLNNSSLLVELCPFNQKPGLLCLLLSNLFLLNSCCELPSKGKVSDADVIEDETELGGASHKLLIRPGANLLSHGNQLSSIKFCHHLLQHLICDGGKHPIVVILTKGGVNLRKGIRLWPEENPQGNVNILEILGSSDGRHILWPGPDVINDWPLDPWDHEMSALSHHLLLHTDKPIEDDRPVASVHIEEGGIDHSSSNRKTHAKLAQSVEDLCRHGCARSTLL